MPITRVIQPLHIAWRIPYPFPLEVRNEPVSFVFWVTPILGWARLFSIGDAIELVHPETLAVLGTFSITCLVCTTIANLLGFLSTGMFGETYHEMIDKLSQYYNMRIGLYTTVAGVFLRRVASPEEAYKAILEPTNIHVHNDFLDYEHRVADVLASEKITN